MRVGVLALQGDFEAHEKLLRSLHSSQWETRLRYLIARRHEIEADKAEQEKQ